jgi:hypothetical protein
MPSESDGVLASVGVIFLILGLSVLIPGVVMNLQDPQTATYSQAVNERVVLTGDLQTRVTEITNQQEVNVSLFDRKSGEFNSTGQLTPGQTASVNVSNETINVTLVDTFGNAEAVLSYVYPLYIGWPDGAHLIVQEAPLLILLATVVMLLGLLFTVQGVFWD